MHNEYVNIYIYIQMSLQINFLRNFQSILLNIFCCPINGKFHSKRLWFHAHLQTGKNLNEIIKMITMSRPIVHNLKLLIKLKKYLTQMQFK